MNNEPVAWMDGEGGFYHNDDYEVCKEHNISDDLIPLYTHPAKELTDDELFHVIRRIGFTSIDQTDEIVEAIRKANEK